LEGKFHSRGEPKVSNRYNISMQIPQIIETISKRLCVKGAKAIVVGGSVRDHFLHRPIKDYDIEVYGLASLSQLETILSKFGTVNLVGKSFGVVINRYGIGNNDVLDYCEKENISVLAKIPNSRRIAELYSAGKLLYDELPEIKEIMEDLALTIMKREKIS